MDDVELTKLEDNFIRTDPKFVMEMKKLHNEHVTFVSPSKHSHMRYSVQTFGSRTPLISYALNPIFSFFVDVQYDRR